MTLTRTSVLLDGLRSDLKAGCLQFSISSEHSDTVSSSFHHVYFEKERKTTDAFIA